MGGERPTDGTDHERPANAPTGFFILILFTFLSRSHHSARSFIPHLVRNGMERSMNVVKRVEWRERTEGVRWTDRDTETTVENERRMSHELRDENMRFTYPFTTAARVSFSTFIRSSLHITLFSYTFSTLGLFESWKQLWEVKRK